MEITKEAWKEINAVLFKHNIPCTARNVRRDIPNVMEEPDSTVTDKHIQINLVIPNYYEERLV